MNKPELSGEPLAEAIAAQPFPKVTKESIEAKIAKATATCVIDATAGNGGPR